MDKDKVIHIYLAHPPSTIFYLPVNMGNKVGQVSYFDGIQPHVFNADKTIMQYMPVYKCATRHKSMQQSKDMHSFIVKMFCTCRQFLSNTYVNNNVHNLYLLPFAELTSSKSCLSSAIIEAYTTAKYKHTCAAISVRANELNYKQQLYLATDGPSRWNRCAWLFSLFISV